METKRIVKYSIEVGNDNGNSEHDIVINGISIEQPNVTAKIRRLPLQDDVNSKYVAENIHDNLLGTVTTTAAAPGIYFSGSYTLRSGEKVRNIEVGVENNKLKSDIPIINTLQQIAGFCVNKAFTNGEKLDEIEIDVTVDMTTALPVTQYSKKNADDFAKKFMEHKHSVIVHVGSINVNVNINFEYTKTLPESVPATFALQSMTLIKKDEKDLTEDEKKYNNEVEELFKDFNEEIKENTEENENMEFVDGNFFKKKRILHVGIGEGTTEYPLTRDIVFDPNFIDGSNNGIGHAIDKALPIFMDEKGLRTYSRQKYSSVLRDTTHKYHDDALDIVEPYIEDEAEEIARWIIKEIERANNEVDIVMIYGGGSILMKPYLKEKIKAICEKANITLFYVPAKYAVTLESKGMYEFTRSKIFKALKTKYIASKSSESNQQNEVKEK